MGLKKKEIKDNLNLGGLVVGRIDFASLKFIIQIQLIQVKTTHPPILLDGPLLHMFKGPRQHQLSNIGVFPFPRPHLERHPMQELTKSK